MAGAEVLRGEGSGRDEMFVFLKEELLDGEG